MKNRLTSVFIALLVALQAPSASFAAGILVDCDKSPGFTKRLNTSVKKLEGRLAKYEAGTPPYLALQAQIDQTKAVFNLGPESPEMSLLRSDSLFCAAVSRLRTEQNILGM